jgi:hypothetical protein
MPELSRSLAGHQVGEPLCDAEATACFYDFRAHDGHFIKPSHLTILESMTALASTAVSGAI